MRFSIRDTMLITLCVALTLGWWVDHRQQSRSREKAESGLLTLCQYLTDEGYKLGWDTDKNMLSVSRPGTPSNSSLPAQELPSE